MRQCLKIVQIFFGSRLLEEKEGRLQVIRFYGCVFQCANQVLCGQVSAGEVLCVLLCILLCVMFLFWEGCFLCRGWARIYIVVCYLCVLCGFFKGVGIIVLEVKLLGQGSGLSFYFFYVVMKFIIFVVNFSFKKKKSYLFSKL